MKKEINSVGIDIGTTTSQLIISRITIENTSNPFSIPDIRITDKKVIYKSNIYFTPILSNNQINLEALKNIVESEYRKGGMKKEEVVTGAVIITGESWRRENAKDVLESLSEYAGDFVVTTAGPDLEAVFAGYGSGAHKVSKDRGRIVINFDIGGGTTNVSVFENGEIVDSYALDIGGRLIKFNDQGEIIYISEKIKNFVGSFEVGYKPTYEELKRITDRFSHMFIELSGYSEIIEDTKELFIRHINKTLSESKAEVMFSGGVSEYVYSNEIIDDLNKTTKFNDIGPLLGYSIRNIFKEKDISLLEPREKIRATVIGAGNYSMTLSGSTVIVDKELLPIKNIPVIKLFNENEEEDYETISEKIISKSKLYNDMVAVSFKGPISPTYKQIKLMANQIISAFEGYSNPIVIIVENDFSKALGQTIRNIVGNYKKVICIDKVKTSDGDYIDIGEPISDVVPIVVKTLIFEN